MTAPVSPLKKSQILSYALLSVPLAALTMPIYIFLPTYYAEDLGLGLSLVGLILLAARLWDVVTDPLVGILSDYTHTKIGRRKTWILIGAPFTLVATWFLMHPPVNLTADTGAFYLLGWSMILYIGWTCMILSMQAWGAELSYNYHERSRISAWREGLTVGGILGTLGLLAAIGAGTDSSAATSLSTIAWIVVILLPITTFLAIKYVPEKNMLSHQPLGFKNGLMVIIQNRPFRLLIAAYLVNSIANGLPATLFILYVRYILDMPEYTNQLLFLYFLCGFLSVPLWLKLSYHFGKQMVWCGAMLWACAFFMLIPFIGSGDIIFYLLIVIFTGASLGADLVLPASMQADVVDLDTLETGHRRTGLYFALWGMVTKLSLALAAGLAFPSLDIAGFDGETGANEWSLIALYAVIPVIFKLIAIALMYRYPLSQADVEDIQHKISSKWQQHNA